MNVLTEVVLASSSPRRTELLQLLGVLHRVYSIPIDETFDKDTSVSSNVVRLAVEKARAVAEQVPHAWVIGADTVVVCDQQVYGKPKDDSAALDMLHALQGREHEVFSGVAVLNSKTFEVQSGFRKVKVKMSSLSESDVLQYVATREPLDKAGAYAIQGKGARWIEWIEGDYYAVVGLPLELTSRLLVASGYIF